MEELFDFTKGSISETSFINCGNYAIDVSGTWFEIRDILIDNAGDKDISVGEISSLTGENVRMVNSQICIASKDLSEIDVSNVNLESSIVGFAAFQKKPEYGPASISANNLKINQIPIPYLIEKNSKITRYSLHW